MSRNNITILSFLVTVGLTTGPMLVVVTAADAVAAVPTVSNAPMVVPSTTLNTVAGERAMPHHQQYVFRVQWSPSMKRYLVVRTPAPALTPHDVDNITALTVLRNMSKSVAQPTPVTPSRLNKRSIIADGPPSPSPSPSTQQQLQPPLPVELDVFSGNEDLRVAAISPFSVVPLVRVKKVDNDIHEP